MELNKLVRADVVDELGWVRVGSAELNVLARVLQLSLHCDRVVDQLYGRHLVTCLDVGGIEVNGRLLGASTRGPREVVPRGLVLEIPLCVSVR